MKFEEDKFMDFIQSLFNSEYGKTQTDNGAVAFSTTGNANLDFFGMVDEYTRDSVVLDLFKKALHENPHLAFQNLMFLRDIKKGKGRRKEFKLVLEYLITNNLYTDAALALIANSMFTESGRADDFHFILDYPDSEIFSKYINILKYVVTNHLDNTIIAKWLPTKGSKTNKIRTKRANTLAKSLGMTPREYRKFVVSKRKSLDLVETKVVNEDFASVIYSNIPSKAMMRYYGIFYAKDANNFEAYLDALKQPKEERIDKNIKMNMNTVSPSEILKPVIDARSSYSYGYGCRYNDHANKKYNVDYIQAAWEALPRVGSTKKTLVVADVSGSMTSNGGKPMNTSVASAIFASESLPNIWKDKMITFSERPTLFDFSDCDNVVEKTIKILDADWGMSTNIDSVFSLIYAQYEKVDNPKKVELDRILIVSDMEFNECIDAKVSSFEFWKTKFNALGVVLPEIVFWNVNAKTFQVKANEKATAIISGDSIGLFELVLNGDVPSPQEFMVNTLNKNVPLSKLAELENQYKLLKISREV
jgi:hypothetical protein